ncbi:hypothetical protein FO519_008232 [Halicephalobus sp. NKZ332]|nr:hypothetical protein FO519_008232 [Halicephalobus sp. NKZ332]
MVESNDHSLSSESENKIAVETGTRTDISELTMNKKKDFEVIESVPDEDILSTARKECLAPCSSPRRLGYSILSFFPILGWIKNYDVKEDLIADIVGGITTGVLHVPQGIAYALLSGVKPINGLYMSFFAPLFYMIFGTSRDASLGSFAVVALMTGVANEKIMASYYPSNSTTIFSLDDYSGYDINPTSIATTLTFTVGLWQLGAAVLKLEFLTLYFSDPLITGFTTGAAVHVMVSQIGNIMGLHLNRVSGPGYLFVVIYRLVTKILEVNWVTLTISFVGGVFLILGKDYLSPAIKRCSKIRVVIPYDLIAMIIATLVSYFLHFHENYSVRIVGAVPAELPEPQLPEFSLIPDCLSPALAIAVVTIAVHISLAKMLAKRFDYTIDPGQEMYALGLTSFLSGFFPVFPNSTALGRTMVQVESGARTQLSSLFSCLFLLVVILFIGPLFDSMPLCILNTVIVIALRPMFRKFKDLPGLWKISKIDFAIWIVSFLATVCVDVIEGLGISVFFTLFTVVLRTQWPSWRSTISRPIVAENGKWIKRICVFEFDSFLLFTNSERFKLAAYETVRNWIDNIPSLVETDKTKRHFVFDCSAITLIDSSGLNAVREVTYETKKKTMAVVSFINARSKIKELLLTNKVATSKDDFFDSFDDFLSTVNIKKSIDISVVDELK